MQLLTTKHFNGYALDCYVEPEQAGDFWATREQIGTLLEYSEPDTSIRVIHSRNKERLDQFSTSIKLIRVEGSREVEREVVVYNFKGLLEICRYSQQPKANAVMDWLWDIADEIRRTGSYSIRREDRELKREELDLRRKELDLRTATLLKDVLDSPPFPLTDETRTVFGHEIFKLATGKNYLAMLPESTEKWYTATEIGDVLGISANKVGRIAKSHGIKAPEGENNEYGRWIFSKSPHSNREVPSFIYNEAGLDWFKDYQNGLLIGG